MPNYSYPTWKVEPEINVLAHEVDLKTFSMTVYDDGVEANEKGHKWIEKGTFIDKDGKVTVPTVTEDSVTFEREPIGILFHKADVTKGSDWVSIMYSGCLWGDFMDWGEEYDWTPEYGKAVVNLLPDLEFVDHEGNFISGITELNSKVKDLV